MTCFIMRSVVSLLLFDTAPPLLFVLDGWADAGVRFRSGTTGETIGVPIGSLSMPLALGGMPIVDQPSHDQIGFA